MLEKNRPHSLPADEMESEVEKSIAKTSRIVKLRCKKWLISELSTVYRIHRFSTVIRDIADPTRIVGLQKLSDKDAKTMTFYARKRPKSPKIAFDKRKEIV